MNEIALNCSLEDGTPCSALFLPDQGMALASFKRGDIEVIDQSTRSQFDARRAGLGVLIGPHFHRRKQSILPKVPNEELFPHIAYCRAHGSEDPFSHGIGRYAPWRAEVKDGVILARLSGKDLWNGAALKDLEGQQFEMVFQAFFINGSLSLSLSVVSDTDSIVGFHYYFALPDGKGKVRARTKTGEIALDLNRGYDQTFHPYPDPLQGEMVLETDRFNLTTRYRSISGENSWQLYHPEGASFVCIEPVSAWDPRHPNLTASSIEMELWIA